MERGYFGRRTPQREEEAKDPRHPSYAYNFNLGGATVTTDRWGEGYIAVGNCRIPVNLRGKGKSKAEKKVRSIAASYLGKLEAQEAYERASQYVHPQKRASQRARKKIRNASRRAHHPSIGYTPPYKSTWSSNW